MKGDEKISTENTKKFTGLDDSGIRKLRKIYQEKGRLGRRELFSRKQVQEIQHIVKYQRRHPHSSYAMAYDAVILQNALDRILAEEPDDFTGLAILAMGEENLERFFDIFNVLTDFLAAYDDECAQILKNLQPLILSKIALKESKKKAPLEPEPLKSQIR